MSYNSYRCKFGSNYILWNSVTVARQTLTLFVGVRIPIPQPKRDSENLNFRCLFIFCNKQWRDSNKGGLQICKSLPFGERGAKPVGNERTRGDNTRQCAENPYSPAKNLPERCSGRCYFFTFHYSFFPLH